MNLYIGRKEKKEKETQKKEENRSEKIYISDPTNTATTEQDIDYLRVCLRCLYARVKFSAVCDRKMVRVCWQWRPFLS